MTGWIIFLIFMEIYSVGMCIHLKRCGARHWYLSLIPFAVFFFAQKEAGNFKILLFPVKKWGIVVLETTVLTLLAYLFGVWAAGHQDPEGIHYLMDILWLIADTCIAIVWLGIAASTYAIVSRVHPFSKMYWIACYLLIPTPFLLAALRVKTADEKTGI